MSTRPVFADRRDAGRQLARRLRDLQGRDVVVVGLPRGGVPVASEVARVLHAPLDVIVVRKLGVPSQPELAMGAIGEDGVRVVDEAIVRRARVSPDRIAEVEAVERRELDRRVRQFRGGRARVPLAGREVVIVDDGVATGSTARAACQVARAEGARRTVLAVPVAPPGWTERCRGVADEFVCLATPEPFWAIGDFYDDFSQTSDAEVLACLDDAAAGLPTTDPRPVRGAAVEPVPRDADVEVQVDGAVLPGRLTVPSGVCGVVVFAHGSGSSRHSPRNQYVARVLEEAGLATLLFDLLTPREEADRENVFDIDLLAARLSQATAWLRSQPGFAELPLGYFGASTGAAAALMASALRADVAAVVSRGGRPDLAAPHLGRVHAPTLLIVGGFDTAVLGLNERARAQLTRSESELAVVPGATHLFEEPGTLSRAADLARDWFLAHLPGRTSPVPTPEPG